MKATGIVRRIDSSVIIGAKVRSLENTGFFADFVRISVKPRSNYALIGQINIVLTGKEERDNIITSKGVH